MRTVKQAFDRAVRNDARDQILHAANESRPSYLPRFTARRVQRAVFKCRQRGLVADDVLVAAGYRPARPAR